ncbi:MAG: hypothetical protein OXE48_01310 [Gammaproteobacteria bacterium]|nr:hypothetical protein [Gammaproteobacteria bacterium]
MAFNRELAADILDDRDRARFFAGRGRGSADSEEHDGEDSANRGAGDD